MEKAQVKTVSIAYFVDHLGKVKQIPAKNRTLLPVLQYVLQRIEEGRSYTEKEINAAIAEVCVVDFMTVRRLLVDAEYLLRTPNGSAYWRAEGVEMRWRLPEEG